MRDKLTSNQISSANVPVGVLQRFMKEKEGNKKERIAMGPCSSEELWRFTACIEIETEITDPLGVFNTRLKQRIHPSIIQQLPASRAQRTRQTCAHQVTPGPKWATVFPRPLSRRAAARPATAP